MKINNFINILVISIFRISGKMPLLHLEELYKIAENKLDSIVLTPEQYNNIKDTLVIFDLELGSLSENMIKEFAFSDFFEDYNYVLAIFGLAEMSGISELTKKSGFYVLSDYKLMKILRVFGFYIDAINKFDRINKNRNKSTKFYKFIEKSFVQNNLYFIDIDTSQVNRKLIEDVVNVTGITLQLKDINEMITKMLQYQKPDVENQDYDKTIKIIIKLFTESKILEQMYVNIEENYNEKYLFSIKKKYKSELFLRITQAEIKFEKEYDVNAVKAYKLSQVESNLVNLLSEHIDESNIINFTEDILINSLNAFLIIFNILLPVEMQYSDEIFKSIINNSIQQFRLDMNKKEYIKKEVMIYKSFTIEEISEYLSFYSTEAGVWLYNIFMKTIDESFLGFIRENVGRCIKEFYDDNKGIKEQSLQ